MLNVFIRDKKLLWQFLRKKTVFTYQTALFNHLLIEILIILPGFSTVRLLSIKILKISGSTLSEFTLQKMKNFSSYR